MTEDAKKQGWPVMNMFMAICIGMLIQSIILPSLCIDSVYMEFFAMAIDFLVIGRFVAAELLRQHDRGWIFYCIFMILSGPMIAAIFWINDLIVG